MGVLYYLCIGVLIFAVIFTTKERKKSAMQAAKMKADCIQIQREQLEAQKKQAAKNPYER